LGKTVHHGTDVDSLDASFYRAVAQTPFRSLERISDHSKVRFTANPKLALWAQTLGLQPFRFTKNGELVKSQKMGRQSKKLQMQGL
jgi:hypothetical protein